MKCIVCNGEMQYHFSKIFPQNELRKVNYLRCENCGFSASENHYKLSTKEWEKLNFDFHSNNNTLENPYNRSQRYFHQSTMIHIARRFGMIKGDNYVDYASGQGLLSTMARDLYDIRIMNFDKFISPEINAIDEMQLQDASFDLVLNCAMFEHVTSRDSLDRIERLVAEKGCFAVHTLVRGEIPADPDWMYLLSVHSSFFTNQSMQILMEQWNYTCSVYNEHAKMWLFFKEAASDIEVKVRKINAVMGWDYLKYKKGFMDYWD